ncbi:MAG: hypothetical protein AB7F79_08040 [Steroidobacteraceae bacterium]
MSLALIVILLVCTSLGLWWQLSRTKQHNAALQAELLKLRNKARALRQ